MKVQRQIILISDSMFPEPALPDAFLAPSGVTLRQMLWRGGVSGETGFDHAPAFGIVVVPFRQGPDHMQFIWQDYRRIDRERPPFEADAGGVAQKVDMSDQKVRASVLQTDSKEIRATGHTQTAIIGHSASVTE